MNDRFIPWCGRGDCSKCFRDILCEHTTILDKNGEVIGYMAEELHRQDNQFTTAALLYAVGVTLFSMLTMSLFTVIPELPIPMPWVTQPVLMGFVVWVAITWRRSHE